MSDVTVAPDGGGAPAAAPANEVVINQNPTQAPQPVGQQAPDRQDTERPAANQADERKAAIQRAFDRANNPASAKAPARQAPPKPAEAKAGHNQPPEPTEKIDLRKPPPKDGQGPYREAGRFARAPASAEEASAGQARHVPPKPQAKAEHPQLPPQAPYREAPPRFSEGGKADWAATSENVRADVHRMHSEFSKAYQAYRADHEAMNPIRQYHQMAQQHGTTLDRALHNYTSMEAKLRADVVGGLDVIVNNLNLRAPDGSKLGLRDVAYYILNQSPDQHRLTQQQNAQGAQSHQIGALHQEIAGLKNHLQQVHIQQQFVQTRSAVDRFADQHPRFDELGTAIEQELKAGYDLDTAYRRAELLYPATHAAQTRTASAQTRPADRSIHGAPGSSNGSARREDAPSRSTREAVQKALNSVQGAL